MPDWTQSFVRPAPVAISNFSLNNPAGYATFYYSGLNPSAVAWPTANLAIYCPFEVEIPFLAQKIGIQVTTTDAAGHVDVGIYDEKGTRLVSVGSTSTGGVGLQSLNIADTWLVPGTYFMAMNSDSTTNAFQSLASASVSTAVGRVSGFQGQAVGAVTLPNPATFATFAGRAVPLITVVGVATL